MTLFEILLWTLLSFIHPTSIDIHPSIHCHPSIHPFNHLFNHPLSSIHPSIHFQHKFFCFNCVCFVWGAPFATPKLYFPFLLLFFLCFWGEEREREREREEYKYWGELWSRISSFSLFCLSAAAAVASVIESTNCSYKFII